MTVGAIQGQVRKVCRDWPLSFVKLKVVVLPNVGKDFNGFGRGIVGHLLLLCLSLGKFGLRDRQRCRNW
jgi:hypothetical protein